MLYLILSPAVMEGVSDSSKEDRLSLKNMSPEQPASKTDSVRNRQTDAHTFNLTSLQGFREVVLAMHMNTHTNTLTHTCTHTHAHTHTHACTHMHAHTHMYVHTHTHTHAHTHTHTYKHTHTHTQTPHYTSFSLEHHNLDELGLSCHQKLLKFDNTQYNSNKYISRALNPSVSKLPKAQSAVHVQLKLSKLYLFT